MDASRNRSHARAPTCGEADRYRRRVLRSPAPCVGPRRPADEPAEGVAEDPGLREPTAMLTSVTDVRVLRVAASDAGAHSSLWWARCSLRVARARCNMLFTEATLDSSSSAVSFADQPRMSRRTNTVRCLGGR